MAVLVIMGLLASYFYQDTQEPTQSSDISSVSYVGVDDTLSAYEQFCHNNQDVDCGSISSFTAEIPRPSQVIVMDTGEIDDNLRSQISFVANHGYDMTPQVQDDVHHLLDKLYEEKLPDDIIDEAVVVQNSKMKHFKLIPERKPPYWGHTPKVVLIIDDMGISRKRTADISSLEYPLTVAFLSYGKGLEQQMQNSRRSGQEIMLHTPMEASSKVEEAPDVLTTKMSLEEIRRNFIAMLDKFPGVMGINNHMGSKLTEDIERMNIIMQVLKERGMYFLDSKTSAKSRAEEAAAAAGIAYAHRHVFLDNNNDKSYILKQLDQVERLAKKNGYAIAIGHPKSQTYQALKEWLPQMQGKGLELIHLSKAIKTLNPQFELKN